MTPGILQSTAELCNAAPALTPEHDELCHAAQVPERSTVTHVQAERPTLVGANENSSHLIGCTVQARERHDSRGTGVAALIARSAREPDTRPKFKLGQPTASGYKFGPSRYVSSRSIPETNLPRVVAGVSVTTAGFEILDGAGCVLAWRECIIDACDYLKALKGPGKIVRCLDRALMKIRLPRKVKA